VFVPHVTLTSDIDLTTLHPNPTAWLERLAIPQKQDVTVSFTSLEVGPTFTKKLFLRCDKGGLEGLGELARWQAVESPNGIGGEDERRKAEHWAEEHWEPHVSLL
jgi:2',3'-cyclic-nucleotide 3'-phosphodiesterase